MILQRNFLITSTSLALASASLSQAAVTYTNASSNTVNWIVQGNTYSITGKIENALLDTTILSERLDAGHSHISQRRQQSISPFERYIQTESISYVDIFSNSPFPSGDSTTAATHDRALAVRGVTGLQGGAEVGRNFIIFDVNNDDKIDSIVAFDLVSETSAPAIQYVIYDADGDLSSSDIDYSSGIDVVAASVVPEPSSSLLFGLGICSFLFHRRRAK